MIDSSTVFYPNDIEIERVIIPPNFEMKNHSHSKGDWTSSSLDDLTSDAAAGINYLKSLKEINPNKIGVYAVSQSGWVTSRPSVSDTPPAFAIVNSGGGATPYEVEIYDYNKNLDRGSVTDNEREEAMDLLKEYFDFLRTGRDRAALVEKINSVKAKNWYKYLNIGRILPTDNNRKNWE